MSKTGLPSHKPYVSQLRVVQPRGFVLIVAIILLAALMGMALVAVQYSRNATSQTRRNYHEARVFYAAEGGSAQTAAWLVALLNAHPNPTSAQLAAHPALSIAGFQFPEISITPQALRTGSEIATGPFAGLKADIKPYVVTCHAANTSGAVDEIVHQTINQQLVGIYQFGIYYEDDLEMCPNFPLDYYNGRIHTNGNLYLTSHNTLDIGATVTAAGHVYNEPLDPTMHLNGKARVRDPSGQWQDLSYDSRSPNWQQDALADWGGMLMDSAHGVPRLPYPLPAPAHSIDMIKRGLVSDNAELRATRFYYKAGLKIIDGVATDSLGHAVILPAGLLSQADIYDFREEGNMAMTTLDISVLRTSSVLPANRIVYISYSAANAAVRLKNGGQLPAGGLTVATDDPLYVEGHYNNVSKQASSILCDAFNVYSANWLDANAPKTINKRIASATTVNTCVVTGNTPTIPGHYGGGAENLIRLHEKWVGHELTYRGSLVCIFESERATGDFANASYVEAQRDWGFDPDLLDPAFWPNDGMVLRIVARGEWRAE